MSNDALSRQQKIAVLLGGTFNPFTNAHKEMAVSVRKRFPEADIIYVPSNMDYIAGWKTLPGEGVFSGENRVELMQEAVKDIPSCFVSDIESAGKTDGKTYHTVQYYKRIYEEVFLCIGSDKLYELERWYRAEDLMKEVRVLLFTRGETLKDCGSEFIKRHRERFTEIEFRYPDMSSSLVRRLFAEGSLDEIQRCVPEPVYQYLNRMKENKVYG